MKNTSGLKRGGTPGHGRPKGSKNKATTEMGQWVMGVFKSDAYREMLEKRLASGSAGPIETYWANRLYGKPVDTQRVEGELIISWGGTRRGDDGDD